MKIISNDERVKRHVDASSETPTRRKGLHYEKGRLYFTGNLERTVFFVLTVGILIYGLLVKIGWL